MILRKIDDWLDKENKYTNRQIMWYIIIFSLINAIINKII